MDIETAPHDWRDVAAHPALAPPLYTVERARRLLSEAKPPANYGDEAGERWLTQKAESVCADALKWWQDGALDSKRGAVVSIGIGVMGGASSEIADPRTIGPTDAILPEAPLLARLQDELEAHRPEALVMHNGMAFDYPFLMERALLHNRPSLARWFLGWMDYRQRAAAKMLWTPCVLLDTITLWPSPGVYGMERKRGNGLRAIAAALGVEMADPLKGGGADVLEALLEGRPEDVHAHCLADVEQLCATWARLAPVLGL